MAQSYGKDRTLTLENFGLAVARFFAGSCSQLTGNFTNTRYYVYASSSSGKEWGANHGFCVNQNAGFNIPIADNTVACTRRAFFSVWVPDMLIGQYPDHYKVGIGPQLYGPNNNALNHPRAER
jgi:hypothetical protein